MNKRLMKKKGYKAKSCTKCRYGRSCWCSECKNYEKEFGFYEFTGGYYALISAEDLSTAMDIYSFDVDCIVSWEDIKITKLKKKDAIEKILFNYGDTEENKKDLQRCIRHREDIIWLIDNRALEY